MSYGASIPDLYRHIGAYAGRILNGDKQPTCQCCNQPRSSWSSTSRQRSRLACKFLNSTRPRQRGDRMRRRDFIAALAVAMTIPFAAAAQQVEPVRRIGVLVNTGANTSEVQARLTAFRQALQNLGWVDGRNVRVDYRSG